MLPHSPDRPIVGNDLLRRLAELTISERDPSEPDAIVIAGDGSHAARTVEITSTGITLEIVDPGFAPLRDARDLVTFTQRVFSRFRWGFVLWFPRERIRLRAVLIRVSKGGYGPEAPLLLGCRFTQRLPRPQCLALDVDDAENPPTQ